MEGVLEALMHVLTPTTAEDNSSSTEDAVPSNATEQPPNNNTATSVNECEITDKSVQSHSNNDVGDGQKAVEDLSNCVVPAELHSGGSDSANSVNVNVASVETSGSHSSASEPPSDVHVSSSNVVSGSSSLTNTAALTENENVDACITAEESLTHSLPPLSTLPLTVPICPPRYLKLTFLPDETVVSTALLFTILMNLTLLLKRSLATVDLNACAVFLQWC